MVAGKTNELKLDFFYLVFLPMAMVSGFSFFAMKRLPPKLRAAFEKKLGQVKVDGSERLGYLKGLRFYLDFCAKYGHPPRDPDSLPEFLQKLASKNQTPAQQTEAAASVEHFYQLVTEWKAPPTPGGKQQVQENAWERCFQQLKDEIRVRQYSDRTLRTYRQWIGQFADHAGFKDPAAIDSEDARAFLTHLAVDRHVAASTQNQAFNALLFLFRHILKTDYDLKDKVVRARRTKYIPVVLTRQEIDRIVAGLPYPHDLAIRLMYGCGLRLFECLNLRVHCLNLDERIVTVHDGKGKKDRTVPLPKAVVGELRRHLKRVEKLHDRDLDEGYNGVFMPSGLDRKWKNAARDFTWQWVFPAKTLTAVPDAGERRRYHLHESQLQKSLRMAVRKARIPKRVTSHTFRHSFASHLLQANYDIRTIQEMLGHSDVKTTMIYTHTVQSRTLKERESPLDFTAETNKKRKRKKRATRRKAPF